jgi:hypothetical protein
MKNNRILLAGFSLILTISLGACATSNAQRGQAGKGQMMNKEMMRKMHRGMMTPEMHEKMSERHKKAAECLRSGKSQKECLPMMGKGMMMKNMDQCMAGLKGKKMNQKNDGENEGLYDEGYGRSE